MIDVVCTQRIKPGMEAEAEALPKEAEVQSLANDKGCLHRQPAGSKALDHEVRRRTVGPRQSRPAYAVRAPTQLSPQVRHGS